jgi:formate dehydrogenase major subunit
VPDIAPTSKPDVVMPFIMNRRAAAASSRGRPDARRAVPRAYEPFESPVPNVLNPKIRGNPVARIFQSDVARFGTSDEFPYAATTYRLTEHFHYWTKHNKVNAALQPEFFVEISHELAALRGITARRLGARLVQARLGEGQGGGDASASSR